MSKRHPGLPIPDDWNGQDWCQYAICWPDSLQWRAILAGFISTPGLGRAWDGATGTVTEVQQIGQQIWDNNIPWRYAIVSSCSEYFADFIAAIRYLADKTAQASCCGGSGSIGGPGTGGAGTTGGEPTGGITWGVPPAGYDTWEEFRDDQCAKLNWLLDTIEADLDRMGTLQLAGATAVALLPVLAATLLDPIPGDELFLLAGVLAGVAFYGAEALAETKAAWTSAKSEMMCAIYDELDPVTARSALQAVFADKIDTDASSALIAAWGKLVVGYMVNVEAVNRIYVKDNTRTYPAADCSGCSSEPLALTFKQYYDGGLHEVDWSYLGDNQYSVAPLTEHTVDGIALSVILQVGVADHENQGRFKVTGITWPNFDGNSGAPVELRAWTTTLGGVDTQVANADETSVAGMVSDLAPLGHLSLVQIWSQGGSTSGIVLTLPHDDL